MEAPWRPRRAEFVAGAADIDRLPPPRLPEVALAGRSNVGKSALLNRLVGRHALARVSKTPGRTQQINLFAIDDAFLLVDVRRGVEADDAQLLDFLAVHGVAALVVVTKIDKLGRGAGKQRLAQIRAQPHAADAVAFSAVTGEGTAELWSAVRALLSART